MRLRSCLFLTLGLLLLLVGLVGPLQTAHASGFVWTLTGSMNVARQQHTATLLPNGKVLVAGGFNFNSGIQASAELYDPSTGAWSPTGSLNVGRFEHTATLLPNGKVLVAGGTDRFGFSLTSAELYDPSTGTWTLTGSLNVARTQQAATLLPNGKVLVAGGSNSSGALASAELYDPSTGTWSPTGSLNMGRFEHTATLLPNGKVLVAGGFNSGFLASAELYDPSTGAWSPTGSLNVGRNSFTATLLPNGKVLAAGGDNNGNFLASAELYDPSTGAWSPTGSLNVARQQHTATLLPNGQVLVAAGLGFSDFLTSAELYDPSTGTWSPTGSLNVARLNHTATLLPNGQVLVAGGENSGNNVLGSAELSVQDTTPPVLQLPGMITVVATSPSGAVVTYRVTATDPDNSPSQLTIRCSPASGSTFPIGTTTVNCSATDPAGNTSTGFFQVVVIKDTTPPVLQLPGTITVDATSPSGAVVIYRVTATDPDNSPRQLFIRCSPASGRTFPIGTTTVDCSARDPAGNTSTGSFVVHVKGAAEQISDLISLINSFNLSPQGIQTSFDSQLQAVQADLAANNTVQACSDLTSFINHVNAQSGKMLTVAQANQLLAAATRIQAVLGC